MQQTQVIHRASWPDQVNAVWTVIKLFILAMLLVWGATSYFRLHHPRQLSYSDFAAMASPLETVTQQFSVGDHSMPPLEVLAQPTEQERRENPGMTAAQIQRANWMQREWHDVHARGEQNQGLGEEKTFVQSLISQASGPAKREENLAELRVVTGDVVIPSLNSGKLPVFSDADTAAWKAEVNRERLGSILSELDLRRAKWFQDKVGVGKMPAPSQDDLERHAEEKLQSARQPQAQAEDERRMREARAAISKMFGIGVQQADNQPQPAGNLSENERLEKAVGVLNTMSQAGK